MLLVTTEQYRKFEHTEDPIFEVVRHEAATKPLIPDEVCEPAVTRAIVHLLKLRLAIVMALRSETPASRFLG